MSAPPQSNSFPASSSSMTEDEKRTAKGLRQWSEYGNVWAASRKAAIKKFNRLNKTPEL